MEPLDALRDLPTGLLVAVAVLILVQLALQIAALISLVRMPTERVSLGGRKWAWAIIIIFGEIVGPIVYFAAGRLPAPTHESFVRPESASAAEAADVLYGSRAGGGQQVSDAEVGSDAISGADGTGMGELP